MKITVTQEHINRGKAESCHECPVALAIIEKFPGQKVAVFGPMKCGISGIKAEILGLMGYCRIDGLAYSIPKSVSEFIDRFDHYKPVEPFEFEIC